MIKNAPFDSNFLDKVRLEKIRKATEEISRYGDSLLNEDIEKLSESLKKKYSFDLLKLDFDNIEKSIVDIKIDAENFPRRYDVSRGRSYEVQAGCYVIPYTGGAELIYIKHNYLSTPFHSISVNKSAITLLITNYSLLDGNEEGLKLVKQKYELSKEELLRIQDSLNQEAENFNNALTGHFKTIIEKEIAQIKRRKDSEDLL